MVFSLMNSNPDDEPILNYKFYKLVGCESEKN